MGDDSTHIFDFHVSNLGERWTQFDEHIFQRGWFNHQPGRLFCLPSLGAHRLAKPKLFLPKLHRKFRDKFTKNKLGGYIFYVVVSNIILEFSLLGKWSNLTNIFLKWVAKHHQLGRLMNWNSSIENLPFLHDICIKLVEIDMIGYQFEAYLMSRFCCMDYLGLTIIIPLRKWVFNHMSGETSKR